MEKPQKIFISIGTIAVVGLAVVGGKLLFAVDDSSSNNTPTASQTTQNQPSSTANSVSASSTAPSSTSTTGTSGTAVKDGQYTASQSYSVPHGGVNTITVNLTVSNGKISAVKTDNTYTDRESQMWISDFESQLSSDASGQSLASYSPSRIGGASLTTYAFSEAIDTIRTKASA